MLRPATELVVSFAPPDIGDAEMRAMLEANTGALHAVAVNSRTAALHLSLLADGVEAGREVVTTA